MWDKIPPGCSQGQRKPTASARGGVRGPGDPWSPGVRACCAEGGRQGLRGSRWTPDRRQTRAGSEPKPLPGQRCARLSRTRCSGAPPTGLRPPTSTSCPPSGPHSHWGEDIPPACPVRGLLDGPPTARVTPSTKPPAVSYWSRTGRILTFQEKARLGIPDPWGDTEAQGHALATSPGWRWVSAESEPSRPTLGASRALHAQDFSRSPRCTPSAGVYTTTLRVRTPTSGRRHQSRGCFT